MTIQQQFRITLDIEYQKDPVVECIIEGGDLEDVIAKAKDYAGELSAYTHARGIKEVNLVNGHEILGFIHIPL